VDSRKTLQDDSQLELFAGRFEILAHLGTGLVGEVSRARDTQDPNDKDGSVAIKILRSGQDPSLIKNEALTLQTLWLEEEKLKDGLHAAPRLIMADQKPPRPFLAMEFIRGKQIPELLRESESRHFDEPTALNAAIQLFRLLSIIHEGLNKTYIDLKMENLWWQEENGGRLRVTDWNVLEERHPIATGKTDPVFIDIFHASIFLYWMLTGELPDLQGDLKVRRLQRASNWGELSDGAKNLLSRLFSHKFETAMQAWRELERLFQYWKMDTASLVSKAREFISNDVDKASEIVSILRKRNTQPDKDFGILEKALKETWSQRDDPSKSIVLFGVGSYPAALRLIENAYPHTSQPDVFRWWQQAVELTSKAESAIKRSMPDSNPDEKVERIRGIVVNSVKSYFSQQYADAAQYFKKLNLELPEEKEIKRVYGELLDVLKILELNVQAEEQREKGSDEESEAKRRSYDAAMDNYKQARLLALTAPSALLPEVISPAGLEVSINELQNEIKALGKADKGKQHFRKGQIHSAMNVWRDGFRLDPDHPELMDFVLSAARESVGNGMLDEASMLLDIIPMSGYSLDCTALRKKIDGVRQKQVEQNELSGNLKASPEEQTPLDIPKDKEPNVDVTLARSAKSHDLVQNQVATNFAKAKVRTSNAAIQKTKIQASDPDESISSAPIKKTKKQSSESTPIGKEQTSSFIQTRPTPDDLNKGKELMQIFNEMAEDELSKKLTIERLERYVRDIKKNLDDTKLKDFPEDKKSLAENEKRLADAKKIFFDEAKNVPLEKREAILEKLLNLKLVGYKGRFEEELGLNLVKEISKVHGLSASFLEFLQNLRKQYRDKYNIEFSTYVSSKVDEFKDEVVKKILNDSTLEDPKLIRELKKQWPEDKAVSQVYDKFKQKLPRKPNDWNIERLHKLARVHPFGCKQELEKYRREPIVILEYEDEFKQIEQQIEKIPTNIAQQLNAAFVLGTDTAYREKMQATFYSGALQSTYKLDLSLDECVEIYKELKGIKR